MSSNGKTVELKVYERLRRFGTKGRTRGPGHAKSVVKLVHELEVGQHVFGTSAKAAKVDSENGSDSIKDRPSNTVLDVVVDAETAVLTLDKFEKKADNAAFGRLQSEYSEAKQALLAEYGVKDPSGLTEAAKATYKARLARSAFYYYEYQMVIRYNDGKRIHSTKLKSVSRREFSASYLRTSEGTSNED